MASRETSLNAEQGTPGLEAPSMTRRISIAFILTVGGFAVSVTLALAVVLGAVADAQAQARQQQAHATLVHMPVGSAHLAWNSGTQALTATLHLAGLAPSSTHPTDLRAGSCAGPGSPVASLNPVAADAAGVGTSTTTLTPTGGAIPAGGVAVVVYNGPAMAPAVQGVPIACGDVPVMPTQQAATAAVTVQMRGTNAPNQQATGAATLELHDGTLTVTVTAHGLAPHSSHPQHIHAGTCQQQAPGSIVYMLQPLVADANGTAKAVTVVHAVKDISASDWYVNVHRGSDLSTSWDFDPILCGDIVTK
jgi:hypothetical protein